MFRSGSASLGLDYYVLSISSGVVVVLVYFCSTSAFVGWRFVSHRRRMAVKARNAHKQTVNDQSLHRKESWSHITLTWTWTAFDVLLLSVSSHSLGLFTTLLFRSKNRLFLEMMPIQWNRMKLKMRLSFFLQCHFLFSFLILWKKWISIEMMDLIESFTRITILLMGIIIHQILRSWTEANQTKRNEYFHRNLKPKFQVLVRSKNGMKRLMYCVMCFLLAFVSFSFSFLLLSVSV